MGFLEMVVIVVVGLLVIGPEKLPDTIKQGVVWFTRIKRTITNTRTELENQIGIDELRRELRNEQIMQTINETKRQFGEKVDDMPSAEDLVASVNQRIEDGKKEEERQRLAQQEYEQSEMGIRNREHVDAVNKQLAEQAKLDQKQSATENSNANTNSKTAD